MSSSLLLCPCRNVRRTCAIVLENNPHVEIQHDRLVSLTQSIVASGQHANVEWDSEGWHYTGIGFKGDHVMRQERVGLYVLALDAINFCFWPHPLQKQTNSLEYDHLAIALRGIAEKDDDSSTNDDYFFRPDHLANLSFANMQAALEPLLQGHYLPNMEERCRLWNELGEALLQFHQGSVLSMIAACGRSAPTLVQSIVQTIPGFRDEAVWKGRWVALYKRAQIAVGDLNAALHLELSDMDQLTTFADYRVPQVLRHWGALTYSSELARKVDSLIELNSDEEVSIRAGTVVCVDKLVPMVNAMSKDMRVTAVKLDWHLWQVGEKMNQQEKLLPHHRVNTIFY